MTDVKICGLTRREDVEAACDLGAAYVGLNFSASSRRRVSPDDARRLAEAVAPGVRLVGVFVDESYDEIAEAIDAASLDLAQVHRKLRPEDLERIGRRVLAVAHAGVDDEVPPDDLLLRCAGILVDTAVPGEPGGTGIAREPGALERRRWPVPLFLAGGLRPDNVAQSIRRTSPAAVDVASGVERALGIKDRERMRRFFEAVRNADAFP
jgi:phosphoribosylanthranilate isomerase